MNDSENKEIKEKIKTIYSEEDDSPQSRPKEEELFIKILILIPIILIIIGFFIFNPDYNLYSLIGTIILCSSLIFFGVFIYSLMLIKESDKSNY